MSTKKSVGCLVVACSFNRDISRLLLIQRQANKKDEFAWEFPGGKCDHGIKDCTDFNEDPVVTAMREFEEETGYHCDRSLHLYEVSKFTSANSWDFHAYFTELEEFPEAKKRPEFGIGWFTPTEIAQLTLTEPAKRIFADLLKKFNSKLRRELSTA